jgi:beta-mannosidase
MKRGFQPVIAAIEPGAETLGAWLVNGGREPRQVTASFHFRPWTGEPAWGRRHSLELKPHESLRIDEAPRADLGQAGVLVCDVEAEVNRDRASFFAGMPRDMAPPPVRLEVERTNHGEQGAVTISTDRYARVVTLDAPLDYSDNYFDMLPGERRTVTWRARDGAYDGPLPVTCWNGAGENAPGQGRVTS